MINRVWSSSAKQYSYWAIYNVNHNLDMHLQQQFNVKLKISEQPIIIHCWSFICSEKTKARMLTSLLQSVFHKYSKLLLSASMIVLLLPIDSQNVFNLYLLVLDISWSGNSVWSRFYITNCWSKNKNFSLTALLFISRYDILAKHNRSWNPTVGKRKNIHCIRPDKKILV